MRPTHKPAEAPHANLTTGDLARQAGTTLRAVRFYEQEGMLLPTAVGAGGRRFYTTGDLRRLTLILDLRELALPLHEIRQLLELKDGCTSAPELAEKLGDALAQRLAQAERRLAALRRLQDEFSSALQAIDVCRSCAKPLAACTSCEVVAAPSAPRVVQLVLGRDATAGEDTDA